MICLTVFLLAGTMVSAQEVSLVITPGTATVEVGETVEFTATGYDANGNAVITNVFWSLAGDIGSIDKTGDSTMQFTATSAGTSSISAISNYAIASDAFITVVEPEELATPAVKNLRARIRTFVINILRMVRQRLNIWWCR